MYTKLKNVGTRLESIEKTLENLITMMLPEDEASEEELKEIEEAEIERGEYAILEEVTKEYGVECPDRVLVSRRAAKFVGEAEERLRKRIISEMKDLENFPFFTEPHDIAKLKEKEDYYRLRIRDIRILLS